MLPSDSHSVLETLNLHCTPRPGQPTNPCAQHILIVDDNHLVRRIVRANLEAATGFICYEAVDGLDAILKARESKPQLIIMDLAMPVTNGFEAALALRREMPEIPVVLLTLYAEVVPPGERVWVKAVVAKSQGLAALIDCVQNILAAPDEPK